VDTEVVKTPKTKNDSLVFHS